MTEYVVEWHDWVPTSPEDVPAALLDLWVVVICHDYEVNRIWCLEWPTGYELTTGPVCVCTDEPGIRCPRDDHAWAALRELGPPGCTCRDTPGWYPGRPDAPACPAHDHRPELSEPVAKQEVLPCLCRYGLRPVHGVTGTHLLDPFGHYTRDRGVYAFRIHSRCPHHGDALSDAAADRLYELVLDPDERGGRW